MRDMDREEDEVRRHMDWNNWVRERDRRERRAAFWAKARFEVYCLLCGLAAFTLAYVILSLVFRGEVHWR